MIGSLNETPNANRLHIGFFGKRNSGKSSLINALTGHDVSIVSDVAGTTTDPVYKAMEIYPIGPCVLIDTAGFDDEGALGRIRVEKTEQAADKTDIAVIVISGGEFDEELKWADRFRAKKTPCVIVINKADVLKNTEKIAEELKRRTGLEPVTVSAEKRQNITKMKDAIIRLVPEDYGDDTIIGSLAGAGDTVLLVMPQDIQAPKGRLILPQVQTLRELLDKKCITVSVTTDRLTEGLTALAKPPKLIITDSQVFKTVYEKKPKESLLTSFSVLFAAYKGDLPYYIESVKAIEALTEKSKVLIAECCTHAPLAEDIGRDKLPKMLRKRVGEGLTVDVVSGMDFPEELSGYDLIIQCGACMFNRKYVLSRVDRAKGQSVPMSNYGVVIAHLTGILDKVSFN